MRVVAGEAGSVALVAPPAGVRPTTERVREVLFASLGHRICGRPFVDLYAGSGAVGIEALSRGANRCLFVERNRACVKVIRANLSKTSLDKRAEIWETDVTKSVIRVITWLDGEPAVLFADPPYDAAGVEEVVARFLQPQALPQGSVFVLEHSFRRKYSSLPDPSWTRQIGDTCLSRWEV
jgi:16S rRNA (guanine966-N2)-methyltransferase